MVTRFEALVAIAAIICHDKSVPNIVMPKIGDNRTIITRLLQLSKFSPTLSGSGNGNGSRIKKRSTSFSK